MKKSFPLVTTAKYLQDREKWLREIARGESISVMFFPKTDRFRRLHQLFEDQEFLIKFLGKQMRYMFQMVDFNISLVEDKFDIYEHLARQMNLSRVTSGPLKFEEWMVYLKKQNIRLVLVLPDAEKYLTSENKHILSILSEVVMSFEPTIVVMSFYEVNFLHPTFRIMLSSLPKDIFENVFYYPLYTKEDTSTFVRYLGNKWDMTIHPKDEEKILAACGGHFWLVKEAVREIANTGKWSDREEGMRFRLESIYQALLSADCTALEKLSTGKTSLTDDEKQSVLCLQRLNFLNDKNEFLIGAFEHFISSKTASSAHFAIENGKVTLNHVPLDTIFSRKEYRVLKTLVEQTGSIVSRDEIARGVWPTKTEEHYSDWAIDQLVARLRKRLVELSVSSEAIQSVRGRGYRLHLS